MLNHIQAYLSELHWFSVAFVTDFCNLWVHAKLLPFSSKGSNGTHRAQ